MACLTTEAVQVLKGDCFGGVTELCATPRVLVQVCCWSN